MVDIATIIKALVYTAALATGIFSFRLWLWILPSLPQSLRENWSRLMLRFVGVATGGHELVYHRDGNYTLESYTDRGPAENVERLWWSPFAFTYEKSREIYGDAYSEKPVEAKAYTADGDQDRYVLADDDPGGVPSYIDCEIDTSIDSDPLWVNVPVFLRKLKHSSTDRVSSLAKRQSIRDYGGDSNEVNEKLIVLGMPVFLLLGIALAYVMLA